MNSNRIYSFIGPGGTPVTFPSDQYNYNGIPTVEDAAHRAAKEISNTILNLEIQLKVHIPWPKEIEIVRGGEAFKFNFINAMAGQI